MITQQIKTEVQQIINVFETGSIAGGYDNISIFKDGRNNTYQITYGRSQTTEQGNLRFLIEMYIENNGVFSSEFRPYLSKIGKESLVNDTFFKSLLRKSAREDSIMRETQDRFFDVVYYTPALHFFEGYQFKLPLSLLVIYDSFIHSGGILGFLRQRFREMPPSLGGNEKIWIKSYVDVRHEWLQNNPKKIVQNTIYRTRCFQTQIKNDNWMLDQPVNANGVVVHFIKDETIMTA